MAATPACAGAHPRLLVARSAGRWGRITACAAKHVHAYLEDFVFRYNRRFHRHVSFETVFGLAARAWRTRDLPRHRQRDASPPSGSWIRSTTDRYTLSQGRSLSPRHLPANILSRHRREKTCRLQSIIRNELFKVINGQRLQALLGLPYPTFDCLYTGGCDSMRNEAVVSPVRSQRSENLFRRYSAQPAIHCEGRRLSACINNLS